MRQAINSLCSAPPRIRFTLIELLIVIVIISLLAAMLMPAMARSVKQAWAISCANRNRQMLVALESLLDELNGLYPAYTTGTLNVPSPTKGARYDSSGEYTYHRWYWHVKDYLDTVYPYGYQDGATQALLDQDEWHLCPANTSRNGRDWIAYNMYFGYRQGNNNGPAQGPHMRVLLSQVLRPSASFVFADRKFDYNSSRYYHCEASDPTSTQPFDYMHHDGCPVFGFADCHVRSIGAAEVMRLVDEDSRSNWLSGGGRNYFTCPKDYR